MLVYSGIKTDFIQSVEDGTLAEEIKQTILDKLGRRTSDNEYRSWENSLKSMYIVMNDSGIPNNSGIAIEYNIPQTAKRVDFIVSGYDADTRLSIVIIELKQCKILCNKLNK